MKRKIIGILMLVPLVVLLSACGKLNPESLLSTSQTEAETKEASKTWKEEPSNTAEKEESLEENADPVQEEEIGFRYVTQEEFEEIVDDADFSYWSLEEDETSSGTSTSLYAEVCRYTLYGPKKKYMCYVNNGLSTYGNGTVNIQIYWADSDEMERDDYNQLKQEGIPELWTLVEKLSEDEETIRNLKSLWDSRYQKYVAFYPKDVLGYLCSWGMEHGGIYVTTQMYDEEQVKQPILSSLDFKNKKEYNHTGNVNEDEILTVEELLALAPDEDNLSKNHIVRGKLSNIDADAEVDFSDVKESVVIYDNLQDYQTAILSDETGDVDLIVAPTALSAGELGAERLHVITILKERYTDNVTYLIRKSGIEGHVSSNGNQAD